MMKDYTPVIVVILVTCAPLVGAPQPLNLVGGEREPLVLAAETLQSPSSSEFLAGSVPEKRAFLNNIAAARVHLPPDELRVVLDASLNHSDASIKEHGLLALAARAALPRFSRTAASRARSVLEGPTLIAFRVRILDLLSDANDKVRHAAILAVGSLDLEFAADRKIGIDLSTRLAQMYGTDSAPAVRIEIIKTFALGADTRPEVPTAEVLVDALSDSEPVIVHYAILGLATIRHTQSLPQIVAFLRSDSKVVRLAAAQALGRHGATSVQYLSYLERAAAEESDAVTRQTMLGSIRLIERAKR